MSPKKPETDYKKLNNRCPACGHRRGMHTKGCTVIMGDGRPGNDENCKCNRTYVKP